MTSHLKGKDDYPCKGEEVIDGMKTAPKVQKADGLKAQFFTIETIFLQTLKWNALTLWL